MKAHRPSLLAIAPRVLLCLVLGLVTSWAVGAGMALVPRGAARERSVFTTTPAAPSALGPSVQVREQRWVGLTRRGMYTDAPHRGKLPERWTDTWHWGHLAGPSALPIARSSMFFEVASGWPARSAWCSFPYDANHGSGARIDGGLMIDAWAVPASNRQFYYANAWRGLAQKPARVLPLRPIWGGLAVNAGFYAIIWGLPWLAVPSIRRWCRRRAGRCPRCGYELHAGFQSGCSECGWGRSETVAD